ncbi:MAG: hypothetical protein KF861_08355 [Planctomycetaceae bacterium]|nr:hypothetical protein [Planctomycetaceae bacterium]
MAEQVTANILAVDARGVNPTAPSLPCSENANRGTRLRTAISFVDRSGDHIGKAHRMFQVHGAPRDRVCI